MSDQALCVCELADVLEMPQSTVSSHVQILRKAGLLEGETSGKWTYYRLERGARKWVASVVRDFPEDPEFPRVREACAGRLRLRPGSCCPGPVRVGGLRAEVCDSPI